MQVKVSGVGKRFNLEWLFRRFDYEFSTGRSYAILGHNGSGKSTLLSILSGYLSASEGKIEYSLDGKNISVDVIFRNLAFTAPYLELIEEFTLLEHIKYHSRFKKLLVPNPATLIDKLYLQKSTHKLVKDFSSGMKQRLKLGLAIYSEAPLLLLDEPTTNLDQEGINWYLEHVQQNQANRLTIISSNITHEYSFCKELIKISDFHPATLG